MGFINIRYYLSCILFAFLLLACENSKKSKLEGIDVLRQFYERAKKNEARLDLLCNVTFVARQFNSDGSFYIPTIDYSVNDTTTFILPVITPRDSYDEIRSGFLYKNLTEFGKLKSMKERDILTFTSRVVQLANDLKAGDVQSKPKLGHLIIFDFGFGNRVVYAKDTVGVRHKYWQDFIRKARKFDDNFYYQESQR